MKNPHEALFDAAEAGNVVDFKAALTAGASLKLLNEQRQTVLQIAQERAVGVFGGKYKKIIQEIEDHVFARIPSEGTTAFAEYRDLFPAILPVILQKHDLNGKTLLHLSAAREDGGDTLALLEAGAKVGAQDIQGNVPLHDAIRFCRNRTVKRALVAKGLLLHGNHFGNTPLHYAVFFNQSFFESDLLPKDNGAVFRIRNKIGDTAFDMAAITGNRKFFQLMIERLLSGESGVAQDVLSEVLNRALYLAFYYQGLEFLEFCLSLLPGSPALLRSQALCQIIYDSNREVLQLVSQRGVCLNAESYYCKVQPVAAIDREGAPRILATPLSVALEIRSAEMLKFLLLKGAYLLPNSSCIQDHRALILKVLGLMEKAESEEIELVFTLAPIKVKIFRAIAEKNKEDLFAILNQARLDFSPKDFCKLLAAQNAKGLTPLQEANAAGSEFLEILQLHHRETEKNAESWATPTTVEKRGLVFRTPSEWISDADQQAIRNLSGELQQVDREVREKWVVLEAASRSQGSSEPTVEDAGFWPGEPAVPPAAAAPAPAAEDENKDNGVVSFFKSVLGRK